MAKIFLCYRRQDSLSVAGRIYDRLCDHFGEADVFMDVDAIPMGVKVREYIASALDQCGVFLAVIGPRWLGDTGASRLDNPRDYVRIEIEAALERNLPVIPVLIDHTPMPREKDLPDSLAELANHNGTAIDQGRDFRHHVKRLIRGIEYYLGTVPPEVNSLGMAFVRIEAGRFLMGSPDSDLSSGGDERPQHWVEISNPFYLCIHQVTQGQYLAVVGDNPSHFKGSDDLPVESVSWLDAVGFCNKLSQREIRTPFYRINGEEVEILGGNGYRLPSEAEWEYACRGKRTTIYPFGDQEAKLDKYAWYAANSECKTHFVGKKLPHAGGLYDMLGNVWEWCADWYDEGYYASSPPADPQCTRKTSSRVIRGGSWFSVARDCRPAIRGFSPPESGDFYKGFRVAADRD